MAERRDREQKMRHMPREKEEKIRWQGCIKKVELETLRAQSCEFVILITEHFKLHLDPIYIQIHNVDWLMSAITFGDFSNPVWEY